MGVALGRGNGNFDTPRFRSSGGNTPFALALGNYNLQGKTDIAVVNEFAAAGTGANKGNVGVISNNGDGTRFGPNVFDTGDAPTDVTSGHFNADADEKIDLATANFGEDDPEPTNDNAVSVLLNRTQN